MGATKVKHCNLDLVENGCTILKEGKIFWSQNRTRLGKFLQPIFSEIVQTNLSPNSLDVTFYQKNNIFLSQGMTNSKYKTIIKFRHI